MQFSVHGKPMPTVRVVHGVRLGALYIGIIDTIQVANASQPEKRLNLVLNKVEFPMHDERFTIMLGYDAICSDATHFASAL